MHFILKLQKSLYPAFNGRVKLIITYLLIINDGMIRRCQ